MQLHFCATKMMPYFLLLYLESCCELKDSCCDAGDRSGQKLEEARFSLVNCSIDGDCACVNPATLSYSLSSDKSC